MIAPIFLAFCNSGVERFLFGHQKLGMGVLEYVCKEIEACLGNCDLPALVTSDCAAPFKSLGLPVYSLAPLENTPCTPPQALEQLRTILPEMLLQTSWVLLMAPGAGPITRSRIRPLIDAISRGTEADILISATPVPANCNPAWLHAIQTNTVIDGKIRFDDFTRSLHFRPKVMDQIGNEYPLDKRVLGSQWLPQFHQFDGAVSAIRVITDTITTNKDCWEFIAAQNYGDIPILYKLPIFQLTETQTIEWIISEEKIATLLTVLNTPNETAADILN